MKPPTKQLLKFLHMMSWIIFIGICIKAGVFLSSAFLSLTFLPEASAGIYEGLDLSMLFKYNKNSYTTLLLLIIVVTFMKALMVYQLIKIFLKINFVKPFSEEVATFISRISYIALLVGLISVLSLAYCDWLRERSVIIPDLTNHLGGYKEFIFMGAIIFMIAQIIKRGIEIQTENDLTV